MKSPQPKRPDADSNGFTLVEVLAALLLMAIIIPVALQGMSTLSRAAEVGQKKSAAMRIAEKVISEQFMLGSEGQPIPDTGSGVETEGVLTYPWTMKTEPWSQDTMTLMTVTVKFDLRGTSYDMSVSTLYDPGAAQTVTTAPTSGVTKALQ